MTAPLAEVLDRQQVEERRRALRALLRHPLLTRTGPDPAAFALVRRHASWLREWLSANVGWSLQVDTGLARLRKLPGRLDDRTRPAIAEPARMPFSRRRYVLACLALAALERADAQVPLGWLAERVLALAADPALADAGFSFALDSREERADLVVVARLLLATQALTRVAGDEQSFVNASGDALYDVNRRVLATLLAAQRGPSTVTGTDLEVRLTARQLLRDPPDLSTLQGRDVFVCENPSVVVEAANRLGTASASLICANTHPGAAATVLLRQLGASGAWLRYHGDFDWPGITIANGITARFGALPWRLDASAYRSAAAEDGPPLRGRPVTASWDPTLTQAMLELGVKVEEERVLDDLLADLKVSWEQAGASS